MSEIRKDFINFQKRYNALKIKTIQRPTEQLGEEQALPKYSQLRLQPY